MTCMYLTGTLCSPKVFLGEDATCIGEEKCENVWHEIPVEKYCCGNCALNRGDCPVLVYSDDHTACREIHPFYVDNGYKVKIELGYKEVG